jgi:membrane protease YdiL (CAAX protease family)
MQLARFLGILVVCGAPAIIGGGLFYALFHSWIAVLLYEALLVCGALAIAYKAAGKPAPSEH